MKQGDMLLVMGALQNVFDTWDKEADSLGPVAARVVRGKSRLHFPNVVAMSEKYPLEDESLRWLVVCAAFGHDLGRVEQFRKTRNFSDNIEDAGKDALNLGDHHRIGYEEFPRIVKSALGHLYSDGELEQLIEHDEDLLSIRAAMALHGYDKLVDGTNAMATEIWRKLGEKQRSIVRITTSLDDSENMIRCLTYVPTEQWEHAKDVKKGGFIADNTLTGISPYYLGQFESHKKLNRYDEHVPTNEKTYADYLLCQLSLGTYDRVNHSIMKGLLDEDKPVYIPDGEGGVIEKSMPYRAGIEYVFKFLGTPEEQIKLVMEVICS